LVDSFVFAAAATDGSEHRGGEKCEREKAEMTHDESLAGSLMERQQADRL